MELGDKPIRDLPVRVVLDAQEADFSILNATHQTTPPFEFGKIEELEATSKSKRYKYELLNSGDEDVITFLGNGFATLDLYAKAEGLAVNKREPTTEEGPFGKLSPLIVVVLGAVASLLFSILQDAQVKMLKIYRALFKKYGNQ